MVAIGYASPVFTSQYRGADGEGHRRFVKRRKIKSDSADGPAGEHWQTLSGRVQSFCCLSLAQKGLR